MDSNFTTSLMITLFEEGGWADDPRDSGGATMRGITQKTYASWLGRAVTKGELQAIPQQHLTAIYKGEYWNGCGANMVPGGFDMMLFDFAVNAGPSAAVKTLQLLIGALPDGKFGPKTLATLQQQIVLKGAGPLIRRYSKCRQEFYRKLKKFSVFGNNWVARTKRVTEYAVALSYLS